MNAPPYPSTHSATAGPDAGSRTLGSVGARYQRLGPIYDWANLEGPLYAKARSRTIDLLRLQPGAKVLDVASGTGASFPLVERRIGPSGLLAGIDFTPRMLERADRRTERHRWQNVRLYQADVSHLTAEELESVAILARGEQFDAALCVLGLSVIPEWEQAWQTMLALVRPGGRIAVTDAGYPVEAGTSGEAVAARPLARLLSWVFAPDGCQREPWKLVTRDTDEFTLERFTSGYVTVAAGTVRPQDAIT